MCFSSCEVEHVCYIGSFENNFFAFINKGKVACIRYLKPAKVGVIDNIGILDYCITLCLISMGPKL